MSEAQNHLCIFFYKSYQVDKATNLIFVGEGIMFYIRK